MVCTGPGNAVVPQGGMRAGRDAWLVWPGMGLGECRGPVVPLPGPAQLHSTGVASSPQVPPRAVGWLWSCSPMQPVRDTPSPHSHTEPPGVGTEPLTSPEAERAGSCCGPSCHDGGHAACCMGLTRTGILAGGLGVQRCAPRAPSGGLGQGDLQEEGKVERFSGCCQDHLRGL